MTDDPWMNTFQIAHSLGLRDSPKRPPPARTDAEREENRRFLDMIHKQIERGSIPKPDGRTPGGELRWYTSTIIAHKRACEGRPKRGRRGAREAANA